MYEGKIITIGKILLIKMLQTGGIGNSNDTQKANKAKKYNGKTQIISKIGRVK